MLLLYDYSYLLKQTAPTQTTKQKKVLYKRRTSPIGFDMTVADLRWRPFASEFLWFLFLIINKVDFCKLFLAFFSV